MILLTVAATYAPLFLAITTIKEKGNHGSVLRMKKLFKLHWRSVERTQLNAEQEMYALLSLITLLMTKVNVQSRSFLVYQPFIVAFILRGLHPSCDASAAILKGMLRIKYFLV